MPSGGRTREGREREKKKRGQRRQKSPIRNKRKWENRGLMAVKR